MTRSDLGLARYGLDALAAPGPTARTAACSCPARWVRSSAPVWSACTPGGAGSRPVLPGRPPSRRRLPSPPWPRWPALGRCLSCSRSCQVSTTPYPKKPDAATSVKTAANRNPPTCVSHAPSTRATVTSRHIADLLPLWRTSWPGRPVAQPRRAWQRRCQRARRGRQRSAPPVPRRSARPAPDRPERRARLCPALHERGLERGDHAIAVGLGRRRWPWPAVAAPSSGPVITDMSQPARYRYKS